ncbi:hypothetical protein CC80DRAFT_506002 [Byssothecium circinans]|uniref:Uncharacterized protein n=1 Tax=Byssothecium circinans TaxID=147558 RepID=A0A6A5TQ11_9PLEO|nr:hypothetical protein CC80DRAFT_506002 [Byssothecium circinans]
MSNSEPVDQFLQRMRTLSDQRNHQDSERVKKLEEELIQGRSERLARRAERARSLSPDKPTTPSQSLPSQADTPRSVQEKAAGTPTPIMEPPSQEVAPDDSPAQLLEDEEPKKPVPSPAALKRSGTLSWQQRPQSGSIRRPLSLAPSSPDKPAPGSPEASSPEAAPSRDQIAQSLGAKDPSWFKQTADRGIGSAAYRRNQDDNASEAGSISGRRQLPGLSRESTVEPEATSPPPESNRSSGSTMLGNRFSSTSTPGDADSTRKAKSPLPVLESQKFAPPSEQGSSIDGGDRTSMRGLAMSPTQGRISPERERSTSPTKGMGGFVQSAMLKRSDSVSKRWSAQAPASPTRQNSTLNNRGSTYGTLSRTDARPSTLSRDNSIEPSSRPSSSSANANITKEAGDSKTEFAKPALPRHSRSKSVASTFSDSNRQQEETSPPSPSKRWSPTKSSWLESALNKPESPKVKQPPSQQPAWMSEISRIKQQRGSVDLGKGSPLHSPPADLPTSGKSSPIKDIQLKPVGLRRSESPKKEGSVGPEKKEEPVQPEPKPKPVLSPKPSVIAEPEPSKAEEPPTPKNETEKPKLTPTVASPKPSAAANRFSKDPTLSSPATKPEAPLKKDFRANLRPRQNTSESSKNGEVSELQSVFGKLKRTETKNYVAPDTFKNNILRGKQGLTVTGGPQPSLRRDEFRESLISQKSAMLAKAQETGSAAHKRADSSSKPAPTPEALAMRKHLGRSDSISKLPPPKEKEKEATPEALAKIQSLRASKPVIAEKPAPSAAAPPSKKPAKSNKFADRFNPALAGLLARGPPPMANNSSTSTGSAGGSATKTTEEKAGPELTHMTKGRARGPKRRTPGSKQADVKEGKPAEKVTPEEVVGDKVTAVDIGPLVKAEHVLPNSTQSFTTNISPEDLPVNRTPARDSPKAKPITPAKSPELARKLEKSPTPELPKKPTPLELDRRISSEVHATPKKSPLPVHVESRKPSPSSSQNKVSPVTARPLPTRPTKPESKTLQEIFPPNGSASASKDEPSQEKSAFSVKDVTASWGRPSASASPAQVKSPIKLPTKADESAAMEDAGLNRSPHPSPQPSDTIQSKPQTPKPKPVGLGLGGFSLGGLALARSRESSPPKPHSAKAFPISPPMSSERPQSEPFKASPAPDKPQGVFDEFFDEKPVTTGQLPENIDTVQILQNPPFDCNPAGKIRTMQKTLHEVTGDGKLMPVPTHEQHILYADSMYLCTHTFGDPKGAKLTEAYLWSGNGVAEPTVEDVQVFARNFAKQNQAKLVHMRQGKETPNFFDALGGIVITKRARPASKEYMLCGRRHLCHIAFDEVEFSLKSFCSGYVFIISTDAGKLYLWKGRGCSQEELSAARLMGMDLTPTGDIIEIDEGSETQELINVFPLSQTKGPAIPRSADHWRYKATSDRYRARLFRVEQHQSTVSSYLGSYLPNILRRPSWNSYKDKTESRPQTPTTPKSPDVTTKVVEIMPFCQRDLDPEYIFVLDAFFETYIIVGALSRTQHHAFAIALMFVQEYTMLAVSEEDRPFMPISTIVLEGTPRDMKAVFRFWDDAMIPAAGLMRGKLGRGKSLRIVGLEKAIEATRQ